MRMDAILSRRTFLARTAMVPLISLPLGGCGGGGSEAGAAPVADAPPIVPPAAPALPRSTAWKPLRIGAGGFVTGLDFSADGSTKVIRTDTANGYVWDANRSEWRPLFTATSLPAGDFGEDSSLPSSLTDGPGVYEARVAPSDPNRIYATFQGYVFKSSNKGATFTRTSLPQQKIRSNSGGWKLFGPMMAVDPANPDIVYLGTEENGLFATFDGGASWARVAAIPAASNTGAILIAFDPSSGTNGGRTRGLYVSSDGNGVYRSNDGGNTFALTPGSPTRHRHIVCDPRGVLWYTDESLAQNNLRRFASGTWALTSASGSKFHSVAVNPANPDQVVVAESGGHIAQSLNGGATWTSIYWSRETRAATDIPWLAWTKEDYMSNGDMRFDPSATNKLYFAQGIGVWYCNPPPTDSAFTWHSQSKGIEQLVANFVLSSPGQSPLAFTWDRPVFRIQDPDQFPAAHGPNTNNAICHGWSADYAVGDPAFIVGLMNSFGVDESGYSSDGGVNWNRFASVPPNVAAGKIGGCIAVSTPNNIVWVPSNKGQAYYTKDRGATWLPIFIPGTPDADDFGWSWAYYLNRHIVAADKQTPGTFYLYNYAPGAMGLYRSTDGGDTWQRVFSGAIATGSTFNAKLRAVPSLSGHLFFTSGDQSGPNPGNTAFMRSTDGGTTWSAINNVREVKGFGFGKAAQGQDYPAIFIAGYVGTSFGLWRSDDNCATWTSLGTYPNDNIDQITCVSGDMNVYGRVFVGFRGSGFAYGALA